MAFYSRDYQQEQTARQQQMANSQRGESRYADFVRQSLGHEAGAPIAPLPPGGMSTAPDDPDMDREADVEVMKEQLLASSKNRG